MFTHKTMNRPSYRQLQSYAKVMKLPRNMKYDVLWSLVQARKGGNERLVNELLAEQKRIRVKRRIDRRVAKIKAENDERLMRPEESRGEGSRSLQKEMLPVVPETQETVTLAMLLDARKRYEMMLHEVVAFRTAVHCLPPASVILHHQLPQYHSELQNEPYANSYIDPVPPYVDIITRGSGVAQNINPYYKKPEFRNQEQRKSFQERKKSPIDSSWQRDRRFTEAQIEDIIATGPTSSTTFSSVYTSSYITSYNQYLDWLPTISHSKEMTDCQLTETLDSWRKHEEYNSPRQLSSNGSPSNLHIDTSSFSPNTSETLSAHEVCEISQSSSIGGLIQADEISQPLPTFQSINPSFRSQVENTSVHRHNVEVYQINRPDGILPIIEEITYNDVIPPHDSATVYFGNSEPLEINHKSNETAVVESKIYTRLEVLQKSLDVIAPKEEVSESNDIEACTSQTISSAYNQTNVIAKEEEESPNRESPKSPETISD